MRVKVNKLWYGCVSVRDYIVKKALEKGEDLEIEHDGQVMTVPNNMLLFGRKNHQTNVSQFKEQVYDLMDYRWKPDPPKSPPPKQQSTLF